MSPSAPVEDPSSVASRIGQLAAETPDRTALVHVGPEGIETTLTWAELDERSGRARGAKRRSSWRTG